jgi:hypothetical protein
MMKPRIGIRDLLWLMAVVALLCWGVVERRSRIDLIEERDIMRIQFEALGEVLIDEGYKLKLTAHTVQLTRPDGTITGAIGIGH